MVKETIPDDWTMYWQDKSGETTICKRRVVNILDKYDFKGKKVLDAGSGTGYFSNIFLMKGAKVYSLDFSEKALELTRKNAKGAVLVHGDVRKIPFPSNSFDYVFSDGLLEHFNNPKEILKEFKRVLKEDGIIITFVPNKYSYWLFAKPFIMPNIKEDRPTLSELIDIHRDKDLETIEYGGISVLPIAVSPEFLGKYIGRLLYIIKRKVR